MSDIDTDAVTGTKGAAKRTDQAKQIMGQAGQTLKAEAQSFAGVAQDRVRAEAQKGTQAATKTLGDFANAVRKAGDELATADHSPASRLVRQAADGLESLSRNLADKEPGDLLDSVRDFGRRNPVAFIGGAVLVGLALGRFVRASEGGNSLPGLSDEELSFAEEDAYDGDAEAMPGSGVNASLADNLGPLDASTGASTASPVGVDEGTSGIDTDPAGSPHTGGR